MVLNKDSELSSSSAPNSLTDPICVGINGLVWSDCEGSSCLTAIIWYECKERNHQ
ncbi:hypothetical protein V6Z12_A05G086900 [Gossypium hirsutum]